MGHLRNVNAELLRVLIASYGASTEMKYLGGVRPVCQCRSIAAAGGRGEGEIPRLRFRTAERLHASTDGSFKKYVGQIKKEI
jgi:hypothetical protein